MDLLAAIENTGLGTWVRESTSIWAYPTIIFMHSVGLTIIVGLNAAIDLRLLGVAPRLPLKTRYRRRPCLPHYRRNILERGPPRHIGIGAHLFLRSGVCLEYRLTE